MNTFARLFGGAALAALTILAACGGGSPTPSPSPAPTPTPSPIIGTPSPTPAPPQTDYRLIYREYSATEDVIWAAVPTDPTRRQELARIQHRDGFGIKAALSPDGTLLAYLSLPDSARSADSSQADAYVIDFKSDDQTPLKVAGGIDYNYTPLWSPDSRLLYMRQYAGPEFLAANVIIVRVRVAHHDDPSPTPTPELSPGIAPPPPRDPVEVALKDSVAHVLAFAPVGFADDGKSMFFLQEQGGTTGATFVGIFSPATTKEVDALHKLGDDAWYAAQAANLQAANDAAAAGQPPPDTTITPAPTPAPNSSFVVQISDQIAFDASLSPDSHTLSYVSQAINDRGEIHNLAYVADLGQATAKPLSVPGVEAGDFLRPAWYPDGRLTVSVLPSSGGAGEVVLMTLDGSGVTLLPQPASGYDTPRAWAPDGTWLAVSHSSGSSLANPGDGSLDLVALAGQRLTVVTGADNAGADTVLGWLKAEALPTPSPSGG